MPHMNIKAKEIKKLAGFLEKEYSLKKVFTPVQTADYSITMENDFLTPDGRIRKKQLLQAQFTRQFENALSLSSASFSYTWRDVSFSHQGKDMKPKQVAWNFARDKKFGYCKTYTNDCFSQKKDKILWNDHYPVGEWYQDLVKVPAVNLLYMLTWDVYFFEGLNCSLVAEDIGKIGDTRMIPGLSDSYVHLSLKGCSHENSFFKNGRFNVRFLGISTYNGQPVCVYEYRSAGRLSVEKETGNLRQDGESYFLGKVYLDMQNGDIVFGDLIELLTVSLKNKQGKIVPLQKRRYVCLDKIN